MTTIVEGKKIARKIQEELAEKVAQHSEQLFFHIVYVGTDPVIENYLRYKQRFAESIGVTIVIHRFAEDVSQEELQEEVRHVSDADQPMIIQLPLPKHFDTQLILNSVPRHLDVDVLSSEARFLYSRGESLFIPPVVGSIVEVFDYYNVDLVDKKIVVVGEGMLVGLPMTFWLDLNGYKYHVVTKDTASSEKKEALSSADVVVSGAGVANLISINDVKEGIVIIDAGTSESGSRIVGDVDVSVKEKSSLFTPVPGGIGPLTIAVLYRNVVTSYV